VVTTCCYWWNLYSGTATFRNITGGTFNVTGFSTGGTAIILVSYWYIWDIYNFGDNVASGLRSVAIGYLTTASGVSSFSQGQNTKANGDGSHAQGGTTIASGIYSHAQGNYNC
jgi:autotransporter adhesin